MNFFFDSIARDDVLRRLLTVAAVLSIVLLTSHVGMAAITFTPFGPSGEGGSVNGQVLTFGSGGEVFELDGFINIAGFDLNAGTIGTSAQLSVNPLPAGVSLTFATAQSPDQSDLTLTYTLTNSSALTLPSVWFAFFVDAEIDVAINDYFNEAAGQLGSLGTGPGDSAPDQWEADEPGYVFGDIFANLLSGALDNSNSVPAVSPDDVSLALGFQLGSLAPGQQSTVHILLSDSGSMLGDFAFQHFDADENSFDTLTISGAATIVPEPTSGLLAAVGLVVFTLLSRSHRKWRCTNQRFPIVP